MKYDYTMSDGDFYRTYGISQEQATIQDTDWTKQLMYGAILIGGLWLLWPTKRGRKMKFRTLYKKSPIAGAFKYS